MKLMKEVELWELKQVRKMILVANDNLLVAQSEVPPQNELILMYGGILTRLLDKEYLLSQAITATNSANGMLSNMFATYSIYSCL